MQVKGQFRVAFLLFLGVLVMLACGNASPAYAANPPFTIVPGHTTTCPAQNADIVFTGTENVKFTTCMSNVTSTSWLYLYANKPMSVKDDPNTPYQTIYDMSLNPWNELNNTPNTFHAQIGVATSTNRVYYGLTSATGNMSTAIWGVGSFPLGSNQYIYGNKTLPDTTTYQTNSSHMRWNISQAIFTSSNQLILQWNVQVLDIDILNDEQFGNEHGLDKNLEFYYKTDGNAWTGPVALLRRDGSVLYTGISEGKDHTVFKDSQGVYRLISMRGYGAPKTYIDTRFNLSQNTNGTLALTNLTFTNPTLGSDFDITNSAIYCRLSAPHLLEAVEFSYAFYYTIFRKENTNNCQTLGQQEIYKTSASSLSGQLSMAAAQLVQIHARDPFVQGSLMYFTKSQEKKIAQKNVTTGTITDLFTTENDLLWPESPYIVSANNQTIMFYSGIGPTRYRLLQNGQWNFVEYLSIPRKYNYVNTLGDKKGRGEHGAAEFWFDTFGGQTILLTSFISLECTDIANGVCTQYPIGIGFVNFDIHNQPYVATKYIPKPVIYSYFDLDLDGDVDAADLKPVFINFAWTGNPGGHPTDLDLNGKTNTLDASRIIQYIVN